MLQKQRKSFLRSNILEILQGTLPAISFLEKLKKILTLNVSPIIINIYQKERR